MTHFARSVALLASALALSACANRLSVGSNDQRELTSYRSWAWLEAPARAVPDPRPELSAQVGSLLAEGLAERGYAQVAADESPELLVTFQLSVTAKDQLRTTAHARETLDTSWGRGGQSFVLDRPSTVSHVPYEDARLTIEIRDASDDVIVWRAETRREVRGEFQPHIRETLAELFEHVPARAAGG
jgi:hypothetical protein